MAGCFRGVCGRGLCGLVVRWRCRGSARGRGGRGGVRCGAGGVRRGAGRVRRSGGACAAAAGACATAVGHAPWGHAPCGGMRCGAGRRGGRGGGGSAGGEHGRRVRLGGDRLQPDEHELARAVEGGRGPDIDVGQRLGRIALHRRHRAHGIAGREAAAETRRDQEVAGDHVGAGRQIRELQARRVAGPNGDGAKAVAVDLHRDRMGRIAHQDDLARELLDPGDLPEHPARIEHGLPDEQPVARALVDQHAFAERIQIQIHDIADDETVGDPGGAVAQGAQPLALGFQGLVTLQLELREAQLGLQPGVVGAQGVAGGDALAKPVPALERARDRNLHRIGHDRQEAADAAEMVVALVDDDQPERQQAVQHTAEQQPGRSPRRIGTTERDHRRAPP